MNTWKVILATLVIFGAGVVTGGLLVSYADRALPPRPRLQRLAQSDGPRQSNPNPNPVANGNANNGPGPGQNFTPPNPNAPPLGRFPNLPNPMPQIMRKDFLVNLSREVRLTPDQRERIEKIMTDGQENARATWERIAPDMRKEINSVRDQIMTVLTPEQRLRFEELMRQRPARRPAAEAPNRPL